ncbi:MAG: hypothetical protein FJ225_03725 [Lentisphaerae bacterium]|nr:hypothetical protein [Lentisphaerota bacterium]
MRAVVAAAPSPFRYESDVLLTLTVSAPAGVDVVLPPLEDRLQGFALNGSFSDEPRAAPDGAVSRAHHFRLTPVVAPRHRVAPIPVTYTDRRTAPPATGWFPTPPLTLEAAPAAPGAPGADIAGDLRPVRIAPSPRAFLLPAVVAAAAAAALAGAFLLARRLRRSAALRRLSPRERALRELDALLARDLVAAGRIKDFYVELTMVVRRYIERAHGIRAPEQTTEEFLAAAAGNARFAARVVATLREFLQAADLVKFAAYRPGRPAVDSAVSTARAYIETDAAAANGPRAADNRPPTTDNR